MLINLSNHPFAQWDKEQKDQANMLYGKTEDMQFPAVAPYADAEEIATLAHDYANKILTLSPAAVHIMGENTFCFALISMLQRAGVICIASTTWRDSIETAEGKISRFRFVRFRKYPRIS
ncbi:hypothetical protein MASR2M18_18710 [Ignavibacteria bacterium]|jgi:hypothetical protein